MARITHVLAACAAVCYLKGDDGSEAVSALLSDERNTVAIHQATLVELCAQCEKADGRELAEKAWVACSNVMRVEAGTSDGFGRRTARWLAQGTISLAQAYAGATAEEHHAILVVYADGALRDIAFATGIGVLAVSPENPEVRQTIPQTVIPRGDDADKTDPRAIRSAGISQGSSDADREELDRLDLGP